MSKSLRIQLGAFPIPTVEKYLPYQAGVLESSIKKEQDLQNIFFEIPLWDYDQKPAENLDILGLTQSHWSQDYCDKLSKEYKEKFPNCKIIYGGPNVPVNKNRWEEYANDRPWVDTFVAGAGEEIFKELLRCYPNWSRWYYRPDKKRTHDTPTVYVDGTFDKLLELDQKFTAVLETTRGCPFKCSFCEWGDNTGAKVSRFDEDVIYDSIDRLTSSNNIKGIRIIDANFGMYERDLDITKYFAKKRPRGTYVTFSGVAKNTVKYVPEITKIFWEENFVESTSNRETLKLGVQTWTEKALKANDRGNIHPERLEYLLNYYKENNLPYCSELIVGLPGETPDSWLDTLHKDWSLGVSRQNIYKLEMVPNMPLLINHFDDYDLKIKRVYLPREFTNKTLKFYHKNRQYKVSNFDPAEDEDYYFYDEMLVSCFSYTKSDLLKMYDYVWWMNNFFSTGLLHDILDPKQEIQEFFEKLDKMPFWKQLIDQHRSIWHEAFTDGKIRSMHGFQYWKRTLMRSDELMQIAENLEQAQDELGRKLHMLKKSSNLHLYTMGVRVDE